MRKTFYSILLLFSISDLIGQSVVWEKTLNGSGTDISRSIVTVDDALFVASYSTSTDMGVVSQGGADIHVSKVSPNGELLWRKNYGGSGDDDPFKILKTSDGNLLVIGNTNSANGTFLSNQGDFDGFLMKIDTEGALIWSSLLGGEDGDYLISGFESDDGDIYVTGFTESTESKLDEQGLIDGWVARFSANGDLIWQHTYGGSFNDFLFDISLISDSALIVCGQTRSNDQDFHKFDGAANTGIDVGWILHLDTAGVVRNQQYYGNTDSIDVAFRTIHVLNEDHFILGGEISEIDMQSGQSSYQMFVVEYSKDLELKRSYRSEGHGNYELNQIVSEDDINLYMVGSLGSSGEYVYEPDGPSNLCIIKLDQNLNQEWVYYSSGQGEYQGLSGLIDRSGHMVACGERKTLNGGASSGVDAYIVKLCLGSGNTVDVFLCYGDSIEVNGHSVAGQGVYFDSLTSVYGCDSILEIHLHTKPAHNGISSDGSTITSLQSNAIYQWYDCRTNKAVAGATGQTFKAEVSGEYKVKVDFEGCVNESVCHYISGLSSIHEPLEGLKIFPNPAGSYLHISAETFEIRAVWITDMTGSVRATQKYDGNQVRLDVSFLPEGFYLLHIGSDHAVITRSILKN